MSEEKKKKPGPKPKKKMKMASPKKKTSPKTSKTWTVCGRSLVAYMADISERAVLNWVNEGKMKKKGYGKYDIKAAFECALHRDVFQGGTSNNEVTDEEIQRNKALLEKARADLAETEVGVEKRRLVDINDLKGYMVNQMVLFKKDLMALSRVIPSACYGMTKAEIKAEVRRRIQKSYDERFDAAELSSFLKYLDHAK